AGAIESAHWMGILHRDVKPANVLVTAYDEPQLADFGIARVPGGFKTLSGAIIGSPAYIAPEVLAGEPPTERSDVYGLGATLFTLVTGHAAYERRAGEGVMAHFVRATEQPVPDLQRLAVPLNVSAAIEAAMTSEPADRPRTAAEFGQLLQHVLSDHGLPPERMALPADVNHERPSGRFPSVLPPTARSNRDSAPTAAPERPHPRRGVPVHKAGELRRDRLIDLLRSSRRRKIVSMIAPAGFGKTTLAAQWRDTLIADGESVVWIPIGNGGTFDSDLADAFVRTHPEFADTTLHGVGLVRAIVEHLRHSGAPLTLFLDGYDRIHDDETRDCVQVLVDSDCPRLKLVITSRTSLPETADDSFEIVADALRFDPSESAELLVRTYNLTLSEAETNDLAAATGGWATALQLVAVALGGGIDPADATTAHMVPGAAERAAKAIRRVRGGPEAVAGFLIDNLLNSMEPRMADFLLSMSAADLRANSLQLSGDSTSRNLLAAAERRNLFVHRTDPDNSSELIPPLTAELLRKRHMRNVTRTH
ncbi:MAG: protein kinase, partial [Nocardiaceae bacterium]|nr:protein kinase [Nocardiaceae bacterium]